MIPGISQMRQRDYKYSLYDMARGFLSACLILLAYFFAAPALSQQASALASEPASDEERYETLMDLTWADLVGVDEEGYQHDVLKRRLFNQHFFDLYDESDFDHARLEELEPEDLVRRYEAAQAAAFWTQSPRALKMLEPAFLIRYGRRELGRREIAHVGGLYNRARQFEQAQRFRARYFPQPHDSERARSYPEIDRSRESEHVGNTVAVWRVNADENKFVLDHIPRPERAIVMVMSARCAPSGRALEAIMGDAELRRLFEKEGLLLHTVISGTGFEEIADWNRSHAELEIMTVHMAHDWPSIRGWGTPNFYFYNNGELVDHLGGWRDISELKAAVDRFQSVSD